MLALLARQLRRRNARRMLGLASTSSFWRGRRVRVIHTSCASTSSTIPCNISSSPAILNSGGSRGAGVDEFGAFRFGDNDCAGERRWMQMTGKATCEEIVDAV